MRRDQVEYELSHAIPFGRFSGRDIHATNTNTHFVSMAATEVAWLNITKCVLLHVHVIIWLILT